MLVVQNLTLVVPFLYRAYDCHHAQSSLSPSPTPLFQEPYLNCVMKVFIVPKATHMGLVNAKKRVAETGGKGADMIADFALEMVKSTPGGGIYVIVMLGDTCSDEVLAAVMVTSICP